MSSRQKGGKSSIVFCDSKPNASTSNDMASLAAGRQNRKNQQNSSLMNEIFGTDDPNVRYGANRVLGPEEGPPQHQIQGRNDDMMVGQSGEIFMGDDSLSQKDDDAVSTVSSTASSQTNSSGVPAGGNQAAQGDATGAPQNPRKRVPPGGYSSGLW